MFQQADGYSPDRQSAGESSRAINRVYRSEALFACTAAAQLFAQDAVLRIRLAQPLQEGLDLAVGLRYQFVAWFQRRLNMMKAGESDLARLRSQLYAV